MKKILPILLALGCGLAPAGVARAAAPGSHSDLWPLYEHNSNSTTVLYPFYVHEGSFVMLFPVYARTNGGHDQHFFWPMVKLTDARPTRIAPVWFSGKDGEFTLFPLIRQTQDYSFWSVPPIYTRRDGSFQAVYPFWARTNDSWFVFPALYHEQSAFSDETMFFPLFDYQTDPRDHATSLWVFPYEREDAPHWKSEFVFPLWYAGHNPKQPASQTFWLPPYFHRVRPTQEKLAVYPFFAWSEEKFENPKEQHAGERTTAQTTELSVLGPLYHRAESLDASGKTISYSRRFAIFTDSLDPNGHRTFALLGVPISERD